MRTNTSPLNKAVAIAGLVLFTLPLMAESRSPQKRVPPVYPVIAKRMHVGGTVHITCTVDAAGRVINAKATSGHPLLINAAEQAVMQWRFEPSTTQSEENVNVVFETD